MILAYHGTKTDPDVLNSILENNFQQASFPTFSVKMIVAVMNK